MPPATAMARGALSIVAKCTRLDNSSSRPKKRHRAAGFGRRLEIVAAASVAGEISVTQSKCIKCENGTFELKENSPRGAAYKVMFVQCTKCGGVAGVVDHTNTAALLHRLAKKLSVSLD